MSSELAKSGDDDAKQGSLDDQRKEGKTSNGLLQVIPRFGAWNLILRTTDITTCSVLACIGAHFVWCDRKSCCIFSAFWRFQNIALCRSEVLYRLPTSCKSWVFLKLSFNSFILPGNFGILMNSLTHMYRFCFDFSFSCQSLHVLYTVTEKWILGQDLYKLFG